MFLTTTLDLILSQSSCQVHIFIENGKNLPFLSKEGNWLPANKFVSFDLSIYFFKQKPMLKELTLKRLRDLSIGL